MLTDVDLATARDSPFSQWGNYPWVHAGRAIRDAMRMMAVCGSCLRQHVPSFAVIPTLPPEPPQLPEVTCVGIDIVKGGRKQRAWVGKCRECNTVYWFSE